jgi:hypothetical protein
LSFRDIRLLVMHQELVEAGLARRPVARGTQAGQGLAPFAVLQVCTVPTVTARQCAYGSGKMWVTSR